MADQKPAPKSLASDEIDLGQLIALIKKGIKGIGNFFLRIFIYFRRNALLLLGLIVIGIALSYGLSQVISKSLKTDVIVRPNFESKNYLYDAIDEIEANIKSKNKAFLQELDISIEDVKGFKLAIAPILDEVLKTEEVVQNEMKYLEVLQNFKDESFVIDILRSELSNKSLVDYKITFTYKDETKGPAVAEKLMSYINTNEYFNDLKAVYAKNSRTRIEENKLLIRQIDQLVDNYSKALLNEKQKQAAGVVYMNQENALNVPSLLGHKDVLLKEIEDKRLEVAQQTGVLSILNFGKTQQVNKSFFNQTYFLIPTLLVIGFMLLSFFKYLDRKAKEIE